MHFATACQYVINTDIFFENLMTVAMNLTESSKTGKHWILRASPIRIQKNVSWPNDSQ
jgi:hypothetical protein